MTQPQPPYTPTSYVLVQIEANVAATPPQQLTCVISADLRPGDRQALLELFDRSSPETRRERFHGSLSVFPQRYLDDILTGAHGSCGKGLWASAARGCGCRESHPPNSADPLAVDAMSYPVSPEGLVYTSLKATLRLPCRGRRAIAPDEAVPTGQTDCVRCRTATGICRSNRAEWGVPGGVFLRNAPNGASGRP